MPATKDPSRRSKPQRASLSPDLIVDCALAVIEASGPDALTFRRLGRELGCAPTAVLRHYRDKDDLLLAVGERLFETAFAQIPADDTHWRTRLGVMATSTRSAFLTHPRVAVLVANRTLGSAAEFRGAEMILKALQEAGLTGLDAAVYYRTLIDAVLAWTVMAASAQTLPTEVREREAQFWATRHVLLSAEEYPAASAVAAHLPTADRTDTFEVLLESLFDTIESLGTTARRLDPPHS